MRGKNREIPVKNGSDLLLRRIGVFLYGYSAPPVSVSARAALFFPNPSEISKIPCFSPPLVIK
jgi:hypothetical protein